MSNKPNSRRRAARPKTPKRRSSAAALVVAFAAMVAIAVALAASVSTNDDNSLTGAPARTGEVNAMGMPVIDTPGAASGTASAAGVEVVGADWDMGRVPLDVAVRPTWTLRNTLDAPVTLGEPKSEVRKGCCPGPLTLDNRTLAPGETTQLTFELSMHKGMDGLHDLGVHVPIAGPAGTDHLVLGVAGDFR